MTEQKPFLILHLQTHGWKKGRSFREKFWKRLSAAEVVGEGKTRHAECSRVAHKPPAVSQLWELLRNAEFKPILTESAP